MEIASDGRRCRARERQEADIGSISPSLDGDQRSSSGSYQMSESLSWFSVPGLTRVAHLCVYFLPVLLITTQICRDHTSAFSPEKCVVRERGNPTWRCGRDYADTTAKADLL